MLPDGPAGGIVSLLGGTNPRQYFPLKEPGHRLGRLEHHRVHKHFAAVRADHAYRGDLPRVFIHVEIRRAAEIDAGVGEVSRSLGVMREL